MPPAIATFLDGIEIGAPTSFERLTLWPLLPKSGSRPDRGGSERRPPYQLLAEALERGDVVVEEISDTGFVPNVRVRNLCDEALLVLFGEELRGAKQNRIANASFLVPPKGEVVIDVSCVEAGRWHASAPPKASDGSPRFTGSGSVVSQSLRRSMNSAVAMAREDGMSFLADQGAVWDEVSDRLAGSGTRSASSAWSDHYAARSERLAKARTNFAPRGVGFVAAIDGEVVGMEVIGASDVYAQSFARLLDAYLIDAVDDRVSQGEEAKPAVDPAAFLAKVREAPATSGPSLGLGEDLRLRSDAVEGAALVAGEVVHLTAAPWVARTRRPRGRRGSVSGDGMSDFVSQFEDDIDFGRVRRRRDVA